MNILLTAVAATLYYGALTVWFLFALGCLAVVTLVDFLRGKRHVPAK